jgi:aminopeptidase N
MLPPADNSNDPHTFVFLSHETAHQWWGNVVAWRSYRDQWLSEGFAEYSGMLYAALRGNRPEIGPALFREAREALRATPRTSLGVAKGRLEDIGPIILGHRLNTSRSFGAYQALIYKKGALVLRMLHFLLSNPASGDDKPFYAMLADFVERYRNGYASTDDFFKVAGEHFARSPIGQKYSLRDLSWFENQWVMQSDLPSYTLEYTLKDQPDNSVMLSGTIRQDGVPDSWQMPLPILLSFANNQVARTTVRASGPSATFELKLPAKPLKVELDPASWVLAEKVTTKAVGRRP